MRRTEKAPVLTKIGPYFLDKVLGSGGFGIVKLGTHESTGDTVAVKIISKEKLKIPKYVQNTRNEIRHLKLFIRHPRIIKLYEVMFSPTNLVLIMECAHGGNLKRYLEARERKIPIEDIRRFFQQIISGLDFCHSHNVMHRDLKPSNILLDGQNNIKIADFGLSCELEDGRMFDSFCGSAYYMSPEICEGRAYIGPEADIWSCGIMLYEMMFRHLTQVADRAAFLSGIENRVFVTSTTMDADLRTLMMHMLHYDAAQRATMKAIRDNAWFQTNLDPALFPSPLENDDFIVHPEIVLSICEMLKATETEVRRALLDGNPENEINKAYKTFQESQLKERPVRETLYPVIENTQAISPTKTEKWSLGIKVKDVEGHVVMLELYAILRDQEYEWHTIDYYHIIVRKRFKTTARYNLMSLQLYRRGPENVLDFRNLGFQYPGTSGSSGTSSSVSETVSDVPKPPTDAPKPPTDAPKPPTDAPKPPTDAPKPPTDAPKPPTDARLDTSGSSSVSYLNSSYGSTGETTLSPESDSVSSLSVNDLRRHEVMEFFEMCSGIFNALRLRLHQLIHY